MDCPKCTGETKGMLRVCQEVPPTVLSDEGVLLTCDQNFHWFALPLSVLKGTNAIQETDLQNEGGMETASNVLQEFFVPRPMDILALHKKKVGAWPSIEEYRATLRTQSIVVCPKCTSEPKGTLRVLEGMRTIDTDCKELCGLICDQRHHWFYIRIEDLEGPGEITSAQISSIPSLENAEAGLAQFDNLSAEQAAACHQQGVIHYPTIAEYRARKKRLRILLVDDEAQIRTSLTRAIMDILNADVIPATNGGEAVELFQMHGPFNLVITDYNMPELNGLEAAHEMFKMVPDQEIILMSADSEVAKEIKDSRITFRSKLGRTKDFIELIQKLCK